ncbi:MAG TPA: heparin lyase I family protein, partial [Thermoleophilaceae bacterium]
TNNASPSFTFSSTPSGGTFECRLDVGATQGSWTSCSSTQGYSSLAQGPYTLNVRATVSGVTDQSPATRSFTVDTTAPQTSIDSGPTGTITTSSATFGFSSPDGTATIECKLDGPGTTQGTYATCPGTSKSYTGLANGTYTFSVQARDPATNVDPSPATRTFTVSVGGGTQCSDGTDNDGDGQTDFGADPNCHSAADDNESAPPYTATLVDSFEGAFPQQFDWAAWGQTKLLDPSSSAASFNAITPSGYSPTNGSKVAEAYISSTGTRAEIQCYQTAGNYRCAGAENTEWWYEWDLRVASGQTLASLNANNGPSILQTKGADCFTGAMMAAPVTSPASDPNKYKLLWRVRGGAPTSFGSGCVTPTDVVKDLGALSRDAWHHIMIHVKWSTSSSTGFIEAEVDGVKTTGTGLPKEFIANHIGGARPYEFRLGIYQPSVSSSTGVRYQYDNLRVGVP